MDHRKKIEKKKYYLYLVLFFIAFSYVQIKVRAFPSKVHLVIQGSGNQQILNENFYKDPIEVWVNDAKYDSCLRTCNLPEALNNVTLVFEDEISSTENMFNGSSNIIEADLSEFDGSKVTTIVSMFRYCDNIKKVNFGEMDTSSVEDMSFLFDHCEKLESLNISHFDTSNVVRMNYMFSACDSLVTMDLSHFKTPKLEEIHDLLSYCHKLLYVNLSSFDTSKVKVMQGIFYCSDSIKYIDMSNFNGSSVINFQYVFGWVKVVSFINLRKFKIEEVNNVSLHETFLNVPYYAKICIKDSYTKNYLIKDRSIDCSDLCFQKNIDVNYQYSVTCKCNQDNKYEFLKKCYDECPGNNESMEYTKYICEGPVGENYYLNDEEEMYRKCYYTCKNCSEAGNEINNNCGRCIDNYKFLNDPSATPNNCYEQCQYYYYFNETNQYVCTPTELCPAKYSKLILPKYKCIDDCKKDDDYKFDYNNNCLEQCPSNTKLYEPDKKCFDECGDLFEYNNKCYNNCPSGTFRVFQSKRVCLNTVPENYYHDNNDNIYKECYNSCKKCNTGGNEAEHNCEECINNYINLNDESFPATNCYLKCDYYYYFISPTQYACTPSNHCFSPYKNLIEPKKKCIDDCKNDNKYKYEYKNNCLEQCPSNTKIYEQEKICLDECDENQFEYNSKCYNECPEGTFPVLQSRNICLSTVPENYYLDTNDNIYKECYSLCKKCSQAGNDANHNCDECINNYKFLNDSSAIINNCYQSCDYNYYFNEVNQYTCTHNESCTKEYNKLILQKHKCIDDCKNDDDYKFDYNNNCLEQCPSNTKLYELDKKCFDECEENQFEYNNKCYNDCPEGTFRVLQSRNICLSTVPEDYYLDTNDNIYKKCYNLCIKCNKAGDEAYHNCEECINNYKTLNDNSAIPNNCYQICDFNYYFNEENEYYCTLSESCPSDFNKLIEPENKCIYDCKNDAEYKYEYNNKCFKQCPSNTKTYEEEKKCIDECGENQFEYNNICYNECPEGTFRLFQTRNICVDTVPENYYLDSNDNIFKECYNLCKKCSQAGNDANHNCDECINNYKFLNDSSTIINNCYKNCDHYYYFNEANQYTCTPTETCLTGYNKLIASKNKCIDDCKTDDENKYEYKNTCVKECPSNTKVYEEEKKCLELCKENQPENDTSCYHETPTFSPNQIINITNNSNINIIINDIILPNYSPEENKSITFKTEDDVVVQVTNSKNEIELIKNLTNTTLNMSVIDLGECETILRKYYNINDNDPLIYVKTEEQSGRASQKKINYDIYEPYNKTKLNLSLCEVSPIRLIIPTDLKEETKQLYDQMKESGYDMFDINDPFYQDICTPFDSENGTDILLSDRVDYIYNNENTQCQSNCKFSYYSIESKYMNCSCSSRENVNNNENNEKKDKFSAKKLYESFYYVLKYSNYDILKCYNIVTDKDLIMKNIGSCVLILYGIFYVVCLGIYIYNGLSPLKTKFKYDIKDEIEKYDLNLKIDIDTVLFPPIKNKKEHKIISPRNDDHHKDHHHKKKSDKKSSKKHDEKKSSKKNSKKSVKFKKEKEKKHHDKHNSRKENLHTQNRDKDKIQIFNFSSTKGTLDIKSDKKLAFKIKDDLKYNKKESKTKNIQKEFDYSDFELNQLRYKEAVKSDKRTFLQLYWAILKRNHLIISFISCNDYNLLSIKLTRFIFFIASIMALNAFFFSDDSMHKLFLNYGKYDFVQQIPKIIYTIIITQLLELFLCFLSFTDKYFYRIKSYLIDGKTKKINKIVRCMQIKLIIFFLFVGIMLVIYWYVISVFCGIYRNTQITMIKDSLISFAIILAYPFVLYLVPSSLRICALRSTNKKLKCIYKLSNIIPFF